MFLSLLLKRLLIRLVCHRIIKMKLKLVNLLSFAILKRFTEFFVFTAKRELDENFLAFFEEKIWNDVVVL